MSEPADEGSRAASHLVRQGLILGQGMKPMTCKNRSN